MTLNTIIWLAISVPLAASVFAAFVPLKQTHTADSFLLGGRNITRGHYVATLTASNAALANILFLYAYWGYVYGIWAWFWGAVFWGVGFLLFAVASARTQLSVLANPLCPELGFNEIVGRQFNSAKIVKATALVSGLAFLFLLTLELNVGSKVFSGFTTNTSPPSPYMLGLLLGSVLAMYCAFGGMRAVIKTDVVQLIFILFGCIALIVTVIRCLPPGLSLLQLVKVSAQQNPIFEISWRFTPFVIGSLFSWGLWFLCTMDMWQRTIAISIDRRVLGIKAILPSFLLLLLITLSGVLAGVFLKQQIGAPFPPKYPLVDYLHAVYALAANDQILAVLLGVVVAGFVAAMLSTVDTYLVIVAHALGLDFSGTKSGFISDDFRNDPKAVDRAIKRVRRIIALIPFMSVALFYLLEKVASQDTFTLYMIAGSIPLSALPIAVVAITRRWQDKRQPLAGAFASFAYFSLAACIIANVALAHYALKSYDARAFGMLYFVPTFAALIAGLPALALMRK